MDFSIQNEEIRKLEAQVRMLQQAVAGLELNMMRSSEEESRYAKGKQIVGDGVIQVFDNGTHWQLVSTPSDTSYNGPWSINYAYNETSELWEVWVEFPAQEDGSQNNMVAFIYGANHGIASITWSGKVELTTFSDHFRADEWSIVYIHLVGDDYGSPPFTMELKVGNQGLTVDPDDDINEDPEVVFVLGALKSNSTNDGIAAKEQWHKGVLHIPSRLV